MGPWRVRHPSTLLRRGLLFISEKTLCLPPSWLLVKPVPFLPLLLQQAFEPKGFNNNDLQPSNGPWNLSPAGVFCQELKSWTSQSWLGRPLLGQPGVFTWTLLLRGRPRGRPSSPVIQGGDWGGKGFGSGLGKGLVGRTC